MFFGCLPRDQNADPVSECRPPFTANSANPRRYRHFAVDEDNDVVYLCDHIPGEARTAEETAAERRMSCFALIPAGGGGGEKKWVALPSHVQYVVGHDPAKGRTYLGGDSGEVSSAVLSVRGGGGDLLRPHLDLSADDDDDGADLVPPVAVPGVAPDDFPDVGVAWTGDSSQYKGEGDTVVACGMWGGKKAVFSNKHFRVSFFFFFLFFPTQLCTTACTTATTSWSSGAAAAPERGGSKRG